MTATSTPQRSTWNRLLSWPGEILATLKSIDARLASIEQTQNKLGRCIDNNNHRGRMSLTTGHWNDNTTR